MNNRYISDTTVESVEHSSLYDGCCHFNGHTEQIKLRDLITQLQEILDSAPKEHQQKF